jgi:hypothetical protein
MWTAKKLRLQAKTCLELARTSKLYFVRTALAELARDFYRKARRIETRQRDRVSQLRKETETCVYRKLDSA